MSMTHLDVELGKMSVNAQSKTTERLGAGRFDRATGIGGRVVPGHP